MKMVVMRQTHGLEFHSEATPFRSLWGQARSLPPVLLLAYVPALLVLAAVFATSLMSGIPVAYFLRDAAGTLQVPSYIGLVSDLGALLWCACAAVCFFGSALLRKVGAGNEAREWSSFFLAAGLITTVLLIDDLFMLHENVSQVHWRFGEKTIFALYGGMFLIFLARFWKRIASTDSLVFLLACGLLGMSVLFDQWNEPFGDNVPAMRLLLEDGAKLLGILTWLLYFARTSLARLLPVLTSSRPTAQEQPLVAGG
ncbi:MAG: hypothetical protein M3437_00310 [Chloroflexota bacterium]|nr:hypothetical protein [Chloroflexota bacterium]MDQ5867750.1 hypothetical protein [Chloroflexota bacterium]